MSAIIYTDGELQRDVLAELKWEPSVEAAHIGVAVKDGIVTLAGHVSSYLEKWTAERAAQRVHGVNAVVNELKVRRDDSDEQITDEGIAEAAVRALAWNIFVPAKDIKVTVDDGWVTLEGHARWQFQRDAAEDAVRNLPGVRGLTNLIQVRPRVTPTDVKAKIEEAIKRGAELDAERIVVDVKGETVTLRGKVRSWAEKEEAERQAWAAPGITEVRNFIVVEPR